MIVRATGRNPRMREEALRELVVGSLVEYKAPDVLFFPHRSLQEYLVAEYAADTLRAGELDFEQFRSLLNTVELGRFLSQLVGKRELQEFMPNILAFRGELSQAPEELYFNLMDEFRGLLRSRVSSPWPALFCLKYGGWSYPSAKKKELTGPHRRRWRNTIKLTPEERMEASDIGCMMSSGDTVATACALHRLLLLHFPRFVERDGTYKEVVYDTIRLDEFLSMIQPMPRLQSWRSRSKGQKEIFSEIIRSIAAHEKSKSFQFGATRAMLMRIYSKESSLASILESGGFAPELDFPSSITVAGSKDFERWSKVRGNLLAS